MIVVQAVTRQCVASPAGMRGLSVLQTPFRAGRLRTSRGPRFASRQQTGIRGRCLRILQSFPSARATHPLHYHPDLEAERLDSAAPPQDARTGYASQTATGASVAVEHTNMLVGQIRDR